MHVLEISEDALLFYCLIPAFSESSSFIGTALIDIDHNHVEKLLQTEGSLELMVVWNSSFYGSVPSTASVRVVRLVFT